MLMVALRRLLIAIPTLFLVMTLAFFMMRAAPGGPFSTDRDLPPEIERNLKAAYDLDKPNHVQYGIYLKNVAQGDLGPSMKKKDKDVAELIAEGFPISAFLGLTSLALACFVGISLGCIAAARQNRKADYGVMTFAMVGVSIPPFVMGPLLILLFALTLNWLPAGGLYRGQITLDRVLLPIVTLALPQIAIISRLIRASMIEVIHSNFIRTARAKGVSEFRLFWRHALPMAILPLISYLGPASAALITGSLVIEQIFTLPGLGRHFVEGALTRDYTLVMGMIIVYASLIIFMNFIADLLYSVFDPRQRSMA